MPSKFTRKLSFSEVLALSPEDYEAYQAYLEALKPEGQRAKEAEGWYNLGGQSLKD